MSWIYLFLAFSAGMAFQKWDSHYGSYYGHKWGKWTREHILDLPATDSKNDQPPTKKE